MLLTAVKTRFHRNPPYYTLGLHAIEFQRFLIWEVNTHTLEDNDFNPPPTNKYEIQIEIGPAFNLKFFPGKLPFLSSVHIYF